MADEADITQDREERMMEALRRRSPVVELEPDGSCYYCGEPIPHPKKFCDLTCSEDYEYEKRMRKVGG